MFSEVKARFGLRIGDVHDPMWNQVAVRNQRQKGGEVYVLPELKVGKGTFQLALLPARF